MTTNIRKFVIISCSILLTMRNVSDKACRENQNTHFTFSNFFSPENNVEKYCRAGKTTLKYGACVLHAVYLRLQIHTHNM
jgi:predicted house-cleaning NTP pyrophosphatase (Maf/HAM1 superfamily)